MLRASFTPIVPIVPYRSKVKPQVSGLPGMIGTIGNDSYLSFPFPHLSGNGNDRDELYRANERGLVLCESIGGRLN